ncbi:MAG: basic amino acid/polyamine antiporter [Coriobacteriia bacterium]|nr:basic amino acid/polyamine antiporter [Coriobacteriia bacterium]MCL2870241.1 basic amino acid/polyamine antiporter [Coriobacteriia bacterium]
MSDKNKTTIKAVGLGGLIALVVGSMVGTGVFDLPKNMAQGAGGLAIIIAWVITAVGMIALGYSFLNLSNRRPDLEGGVFSYAREGFGEYWGFNNAWAYWISALLGNVAYAVGLLSAIQFFLPNNIQIFGDGGPTVLGIVLASAVLWLVHFLIVRGVQGATLVNLVVTIAKAIPLILFAIIVVVAFNFQTFADSFLGGLQAISWAHNVGEVPSILEQVRSTMLATVWAFIGIEGAVLFSSRARNKGDVGRATIIGLLAVIVLYMVFTVCSLGVMAQTDIAAIDTFPATAVILQSIVGEWGAVVINAGVIISISGAWLAWTLFGAETPYLAAKQGLFPPAFAKLNKNETPVFSLVASNLIIQLFLILVFFAYNAYEFGYTMASSAILFPYAFSAFFQVKYMLGQKKATQGRVLQLFIGVVASIYAIWLLYGAGLDYMAFTCLLFVPALGIFIYNQRKKGARPIMKAYEWIFAAALSVAGFLGLYWVIIGRLALFS